MGEQAVTGAGATPAPEQTPDAGGDDAAAATGSGPAGPATAGMTVDGSTGVAGTVPGAGMSADGPNPPDTATPGAGMDADAASGATRTADIVPGPGGVMTDEVGVVTGELTLRTSYADGRVTLGVQYRDADEWYRVTGGSVPLPDPSGLDAVHGVAVALLHRPEG
ncbi:hypothetical protein DKT68_13245 [Micromonospora acroterricola]|uniref:Uncharacterized protein n=1 Tax=Micromonospora acroterricola TaxID=2202421 RepID=A0A317D8Y3_9ACTN|nr:hypothetical protein [Micromonospora acroterricola]PWR09095.1 hypothetical protein DKT68_13245 [Micromonospora acroterricola]